MRFLQFIAFLLGFCLLATLVLAVAGVFAVGLGAIALAVFTSL